ncbi:MAG: glycosyltransferase family 39 protein [Acidimicrobiales bacterium]|nr:glycosyltransferase family 39 protein [Acidimicrobiales bacterium]
MTTALAAGPGATGTRSPSRERWTRAQAVALVALLAVASFVLLFRLGTAGWSVDEPVYRDAGRAYVDGDFSTNREHPLLAKLLIGVSLQVAGDGEVGTRLPAALSGLVVGLALLGLGSRMAGRWAGLAAAGLWWLLPVAPGTIVGRIDRYGLLEPPMLAFGTLALYLAWRWSESGRARWGVGAGVALGLAAACKLTGGLALPAVALAAWWSPGASAGTRRRIAAVGVAALCAAGAFLAVALVAGTDGLHALRFAVDWQLDHAAAGHAQLVAGRTYLHPPWWSPWWFQARYLGWFALAALWGLAALGAALGWRARRRAVAFTLTALVPVVAAVSLAGLKLPHYHVAWIPPLALLAGIGLADGWRRAGPARAGVAVAVVVLAVAAVGLVARIATLQPEDYAALPAALRAEGLADELAGARVAVWGYPHLVEEALPGRAVTTSPPTAGAAPPDVVVVDPVVADRQPDSPFRDFVDDPGPYDRIRVGRLDVYVRR